MEWEDLLGVSTITNLSGEGRGEEERVEGDNEDPERGGEWGRVWGGGGREIREGARPGGAAEEKAIKQMQRGPEVRDGEEQGRGAMTTPKEERKNEPEWLRSHRPSDDNLLKCFRLIMASAPLEGERV